MSHQKCGELSLPSSIDPVKAHGSFMNQRDALTLLLQSNLTNFASKLYSKSIISQDALLEALSPAHIASVRTVSLLGAVEAKIKAEPDTFRVLVDILESEPSLQALADRLRKDYHDSSNTSTSTVTISPAISRYGDYLKGVYSRSPVSNDGKFPPTPSKEYINLAISHFRSQRDLKELMQHTLHGCVNEILREKQKIEINDILKPDETGKAITLAFVEGPPGIGKSTLAWELCRRWDRKQYDLAVLLRLRKREVQQISDITGLFPHYNKELQRSVAEGVAEKEGERVLFVLDGYDELPVNFRHEGILTGLLSGDVLPKCSIVVTSRPSATRDLYMICRPLIARHVEILGFTDECVKEYATSIFSSDPEMLDDFLLYVSASENPAINSLMYIPLNAAIIVDIYRNNRKKGFPIPRTMTQLYTQLCLTILQRHLNVTDIANFADLPGAYSDHFLKLAQLAFKKFEQHEVVFYSESVPSDMVHFGFLDSVPALYSGGGVSYNFLHLTLQEFLAAYYIITQLNGGNTFHCYGNDPRWNIVWRFVSGLTGFQHFEKDTLESHFVARERERERVHVSLFFMQCLFEAQIIFDYKSAFEGSTICVQSRPFSSPLDMYALGYCIVNSSATWKVVLHTFFSTHYTCYTSGLHFNPSGAGTICHLTVSISHVPFLYQYPINVLQSIKHMCLYFCLAYDGTDFVQRSIEGDVTELPLLMKQLRCLSLTLHYSVTPILSPGLLDQVSHSYADTSDYILRIKEELPENIEGQQPDFDTKSICYTLFHFPLFNYVSISLHDFTEDCFASLKTNTTITDLHIECTGTKDRRVQALPILTRILENNTTIERLSWYPVEEHLSSKQVDKFNRAIGSNRTLKKLTLYKIEFSTSCEDPIRKCVQEALTQLLTFDLRVQIFFSKVY